MRIARMVARTGDLPGAAGPVAPEPVHAAASRVACPIVAHSPTIPTLPVQDAAPAGPARRPGTHRLQPLLVVAPPDARPVQPHRPDRLAALPQPGGRAPGPSRLVRRSSTTPTSWSSTGPSSPPSTPTWPTARTTGSTATTATSWTGPVAYFCAEFGLHESLGIYSGGLGVLAGDHCKAASDMALPFVAVGLFYRHGYFRQSIDADGHQEHAYPDLDVVAPAAPARRGRGRRPAHGARGAARPNRPCRGLAGPGGPRAAAAAGHRHAPQRRDRTGPSPTSCTCAAARCASTRSWSWASAACARCARWASRPRPGTSTRATRRSCSWSGRASWSRPACPFEAALDAGPLQVGVHHPHARLGGQRALRRGPGAHASRRRMLDGTGLDMERILELGRGVDGDPAQFDMTALLAAPDDAAPTPSASCTRETANATWQAIIRPTHPGHHQRRPPAHLAGRPHPGAVRGPGRGPRPPRRRATQGPLLGAAATGLRRAAVGRPHGAEAGAGAVRAGPAADPARAPRRAARRSCTTSRRPRPGHPDHRLRAPVRDLQARRAPVQRRGAAGAAAVGHGAAGPDRVRGQGAPGRPARPAGHPGHLQPQPLEAAQGPRVHPRGLRHPRRAATWSRASTSGSTTRGGPSRRPAPAA